MHVLYAHSVKNEIVDLILCLLLQPGGTSGRSQCPLSAAACTDALAEVAQFAGWPQQSYRTIRFLARHEGPHFSGKHLLVNY
jgi:hypothetical protein